MTPEAIRSCLKFLESQEHKYKELMATGDVATKKKRPPRPKDDVVEAYFHARSLMAEGLSKAEALKEANISRRSFERYKNRYAKRAI